MIWLLQATAHLAAGIARVGPARLESKVRTLAVSGFVGFGFTKAIRTSAKRHEDFERNGSLVRGQ